MCGIFGIFPDTYARSKYDCGSVLKSLFEISETRGHDASGLAILTKDLINVYKEPISAHELVKTDTFGNLVRKPDHIQAAIGHARMETNGSYGDPRNNQPVVKDGIVTIHNGIIVNDAELWNRYPEMKRDFNVDTEVINSVICKYLKEGNNILEAYLSTLNLLKGSYSLCHVMDNYDSVLLSTNTGSLYRLVYKDKTFIFASERYFLERLLHNCFSDISIFNIQQMKPCSLLSINVRTGDEHFTDFSTGSQIVQLDEKRSSRRQIKIESYHKSCNTTHLMVKNKDLGALVSNEYSKNIEKIRALKRCTKCILPETMPFIEFDDQGVCNYCNNYHKVELLGKEFLMDKVAKYKETRDRPNCIVAFSGGRDSSYGLHYIKKELGLNPVAYSYDWGMLTDLGRRNQARMTGTLGVEHILISADIGKKRENIRKNVEAWLKHPDLGTVPLFMAGDKQYFYYANLLKKQMQTDLVILCENLLERTDFKSGFCGIAPKQRAGKNFYSLNLRDSFKLLAYYAKEYIINPAYLNSSLLDSLWAFQSYYFISHDYLSLYKYIKWDEKTVEDTLKQYDWEVSPDTPTTWRIGDGTAAFYNYIYYTKAGLSENDTFRSNQVREGVLDRKLALEIAMRDNTPRPESLAWYGNVIGVDMSKAISIINQSSKRYG